METLFGARQKTFMGRVHPLENPCHVEWAQQIDKLSIYLYYSFNLQIFQALAGHSYPLNSHSGYFSPSIQAEYIAMVNIYALKAVSSLSLFFLSKDSQEELLLESVGTN